MAGLSDLFGKGSIAEQIFVWGILNQVIAALASPFFEQLTQEVNSKHPVTELSPPQLAQLVVRNFVTPGGARDAALKAGLTGDKFDHLVQLADSYLSPGDLAQLVVRNFTTPAFAQGEALKSGMDAERFALLTKIAADAPAPGDLAVALRRKLIPEDAGNPDTPSFAGGVREGRLGDKWIPVLKELATQWPSPSDALKAELTGQLTHAQALAEYERLGGDAQFYTWLFNTEGNAPTPSEALDLVNRGIIPVNGTGPDAVSYEQAFLEGPWRNKWEKVFLALREYVTPPRSVVAMVHNGALTDGEAAAELAKSGLSPSMVGAYIAEGHQRAAATSRDLTQSAVIDLYSARIIAQADAHGLLVALGYSDTNATYLLELADLRRSIAAVNTAVSRVHTLYVSHKITRAAAQSVLDALHVPGEQTKQILSTWDLENAVNVKQLTEAQIVDAWHVNIIDQGEAQTELESIGYTPRDAWILLSIKAKGAVGSEPPRGPAPVGVIP
jgi:hypothetical protein